GRPGAAQMLPQTTEWLRSSTVVAIERKSRTPLKRRRQFASVSVRGENHRELCCRTQSEPDSPAQSSRRACRLHSASLAHPPDYLRWPLVRGHSRKCCDSVASREIPDVARSPSVRPTTTDAAPTV